MLRHHHCRWLHLLGALGILALLPGLCNANQFVVQPGQSIAAALASAAPGDSVMVAPGTYHEEGLLLPAGVLLAGLDPWDPPVIAPQSGRHSLLTCRDISGAHIQSIHFSGSDIPEYAVPRRGGGVLVENASVRFQSCRFLGLRAIYGGAAYITGGREALFTACSFEGNEAFTSGGAVAAVGVDSLVFQNALFTGNRAPLGGSVLNATLRSRVYLQYSTLANNGMAGSSDLAAWDNDYLEVHASIIYGSAGMAFMGDESSPLGVGCTDIYGCAQGDWTGLLAPFEGENHNLNADPLFCGEDQADNPWMLSSNSPCAPDEQPLCELVGAFPTGCDPNAGTEPLDDGRPVMGGVPLVTRLAGNYPNPFNPSTTISLDINRPDAVRVDIYDLAGRRVRGLFSGSLAAGSHTLVWDGRGQDGRLAAAGVYFVRLKTESVIDTRRMLLVK